jgi:hypothetical protein
LLRAWILSGQFSATRSVCTDQTPASTFNPNAEEACPGVKSIFHELFDHRGRSLNYFSGGDLGSNFHWQYMDGHASIITKASSWQLVADCRYNCSMNYSTIFFDLDDTLYPKTSGLWGAIRERMGVFMVERLGLPAEEVPIIRKTYFETYGTTLRGLQIHYHVNSDEYLSYVHDLHLRNTYR